MNEEEDHDIKLYVNVYLFLLAHLDFDVQFIAAHYSRVVKVTLAAAEVWVNIRWCYHIARWTCGNVDPK